MKKLNLLSNSHVTMSVGINPEVNTCIEGFNILELDPVLYDALAAASMGETILSLSLFDYLEYVQNGYIRYLMTTWDGHVCGKYCGRLYCDGTSTRDHVDGSQYL